MQHIKLTRIPQFVLALRLLHPQRAAAEDHVDVKQEVYKEDNGRIEVNTSALEVEKKLTASTIARAKLVYDSISGASPNGLPPQGGDQVPLKELTELRRAVNVELSQRWRANTFTPSFAYSIEHDYESYGAGYTQAIEFNQRNTSLVLGVAGTSDKIYPKSWFGRSEYKKSGDVLLGLTQLLGPKTILTINFTAGLSHGYLSDPYKAVHFTYYPDPNYPFPEQRPKERTKEVGFLSLRHHVTPLNGSGELEYRIYHDSYGIFSHTVSLNWHQKLGRHLVLSPTLRFTQQSAANFYVTELPGDPSCPISNPLCPDVPIPALYSADYRLSALHTWTYGFKADIHINDRLSIDFAYKRYTMHGDDHVTSASAYPSANIFTGGLTLWF